MTRLSHHVEPHGVLQIARHYVRELIYGASDGIITTFAVVAGVAGGGLPLRVVLIIGAANLLADGLSMAVGNYLSIRALRERAGSTGITRRGSLSLSPRRRDLPGIRCSGRRAARPIRGAVAADRPICLVHRADALRNVRRRCVARAHCQRPMVEGGA